MILETLCISLIVLVLLFFAIYLKLTRNNEYWRNRGIPYVPNQFPTGSSPFTDKSVLTGKVNQVDFVRKQADAFTGCKYYGTFAFGDPVLVVTDPCLVQDILVRDFDHFVDRNGETIASLFNHGTTQSDSLWTKQITLLRGDQWKDLRTTFTPIFTSGKMKIMLPLIDHVCQQMVAEITKISYHGQPVDIGDLFEKFSMDTVACCAFGVEAQSFQSGQPNYFLQLAHKILMRNPGQFWRLILVRIPGMKALMRSLGISVFKGHELVLLHEIVVQTLKYRKETHIHRNDLVDIMLEAMSTPPEDGIKPSGRKYSNNQSTLDESLVMAAAVVFLFGGYETTATTLSYACYELAKCPQAQKKLQSEIDREHRKMKYTESHLEYSTLQSMTYLDQVIQEALRLHTPLGVISRGCVSDYQIPGDDLVIKRGQEVHIPVASFHMNPAFFPEPHIFDPERFNHNQRQSRHQYLFLPFGVGPRSCLGMRFALLEAKAALVSLFRHFTLDVCSMTPTSLRLNPKAILGNSQDPIYLRAVPREVEYPRKRKCGMVVCASHSKLDSC